MQINRCMNCMKETGEPVCPHCGYDARTPQETTFALRPGTILNGRYLIGRTLGRGGFGITYVGFNLALETRVAVKEYFPANQASRNHSLSNELRWSSDMLEADQWKKGCDGFLKEARKMARVQTIPEIVRVLDTFSENRTTYIVMDYIEGETLKDHLMKSGPMAFWDCVEALLPLMRGLESIHRQGIIHRDISPDNIMVLPGGEVRLLDLGAAKDLTKQSGGSTQMVIKHGFSPMEQYSETGRIGPWTDVYALCATMYYCITGRLIPDAADRIDGMEISFDGAELPEAAKEALLNGLEMSTGRRIQSMAELAERLEACTAGKEAAPAAPKAAPIVEAAPQKKPEPEPRAGQKPAAPTVPARESPEVKEEPAPVQESVRQSGSASPPEPARKGKLAPGEGKNSSPTIRRRLFTGIALCAALAAFLAALFIPKRMETIDPAYYFDLQPADLLSQEGSGDTLYRASCGYEDAVTA